MSHIPSHPPETLPHERSSSRRPIPTRNAIAAARHDGWD